MCPEPPRPLAASASLSSALDVLWTDRRWRLLHAPLGEVTNLARAVFLHPDASWFFLDHQQVQLAVVAQLRGAAPGSAPGNAPGPGVGAGDAVACAGRACPEAEPAGGAAAGPRGVPTATRPTDRDRSGGAPGGGGERGRLVVEELRALSPPFRRLWSGLRTRYRPRTSYAVHHPDLGPVALERFVSWTAGTHWHERVQPAGGDRAAEVLSLLDLL
ncbi:hypothetical protein FHR75_000234 [Kineococcus radiotolerans]|uniref:MmyB-like transcription regulator ligand binding domain-containing protein n=1 Tax=Kineococcus radiotolerans TaxID=131568 RepID=A0A7W4XUY7_KINRA|nr:hypothetical protein [Kineococcus radiotolerans]MBB2899446.1 hypothetical protein [Kineococcus radiotolerans]